MMMSRTNRYAQECELCGEVVPAGAGILRGSSGAWEVIHADGCPEADDAGESAPVVISLGEGYGGKDLPGGTVMRDPRPGEEGILYVMRTESRYVCEDGMSFGVGAESGYIYTHYARPATDEEAAPLLEREAEKKARAECRQQLQQVERQIVENGEKPDASEGLLNPEGEHYGGEPNIYGGGSWFVVGDEHIWYVRNNGMDGDDWSLNNVATGGAGAIGWRVPYSEEMAETIRQCST